MSKIKKYGRWAWEAKNFWMAILFPLLLLPFPIIVNTKVAKCGYCILVVAFYWVTEAVPLAITSLLPIPLFPLFGVMTAKQVCQSYVKDTLMLFLGSLIIAVAVERWNLHRRLALRTLTLVGTSPLWLMLGVMLPCWFLSMWMSNTATTAMMMPIVSAILLQIKETKNKERAQGILMQEKNAVNSRTPSDTDHTEETLSLTERGEGGEDTEFLHLAKTFSLCAAFAANIGGLATLTGTPPNIIFKGQADILFQEYGLDSKVDFASWLVIGIPISIICFVACWFWLFFYSQGRKCLRVLRGKDSSYSGVKAVLLQQYREMGSMTFAEVVVMISFLTLALLWVTRKPGFVPGWSDLFLPGYVADSTPSILISALLFILPAYRPKWTYCGSSREAAEEKPFTPLLNWHLVHERVAWGVLLLMGGGFAVADASQHSGLSGWVSDQLTALRHLPGWLVALLLALIVNAATEVTSNAATTTLFAPIAGELAIKLQVHPLYFMIPVTISASLAFLLPVATPPNAIAFATGYLKVKDMVLGGSGINAISLVVMLLGVYTWTTAFFQLDQLPEAMRIDVLNMTAETALNLTTSP